MVATTGTIVLLAFSTLYAVRHDTIGANAFGLITTYIGLVCISLLCLVRTHAAQAGPAYLWRLHRPDLLYSGVSNESPALGYCNKCEAPKGARVHHCSICNACVLRFDHHCAWVGNCVGMLNAKFFVLFLLYATAAGLFTIALHLRFLLHCRVVAPKEPGAIVAAAFIVPIALAMALVATATSAAILAWHLWLAARNETALENFRGQPGAWGRASVIANLRHLFGWRVCLWLLPIRQSNTPPL